MPNNITGMALIFTIVQQQPMAEQDRIGHLAHILQEGAGIPSGLRFRLRYGMPAMDEQEQTLDHLMLSGHVIRVSRWPTKLRAALPAEPEWQQEMERLAPRMRRLDALGERNTRELQLMSALIAAGAQGHEDPAKTVGRTMPRVEPGRLERLQAELRETGMLPTRQEEEER